MTDRSPEKVHRIHEDVLAVLLGTLVVALGLTLYAEATLITSGLAGLALLLQFGTGLGLGLIFFLLNLPFYLLALRRLGWKPTIRTFIAVGLLSVFVRFTPDWIRLARIEPVYAALIGGGLMGLGLLILFRHRTGLGGVNLLALYLQDHYGIRAGYFQLAVDVVILLAACFVIPLDKVALSLAGAVVLNLVVGINHKPGRYTAVS